VNWDLIIKIIELLLGGGIFATLIKGLFALNRFLFLMGEYPPHRHVGRKIQYPKGYAPDPLSEEDHKGARVGA